MASIPPAVRRRADDVLNKERVAALIGSYEPKAPVVWSASRVLQGLKVAGRRRPPATLKRRARRILEALAAEGVLLPKAAPALNPDGSSEVAYVLAVKP
jgi:hypothetical protein